MGEIVFTVTKTTGTYTQKSYAAVARECQLEWIFLQCTTKDTGKAFLVVEKVLWGIFFASSFLWNIKPLSPVVGSLSTLLVKKSGMGIHNPVTSAADKNTI